jgi:CelD/BcsL family acetyltransferase involved in cellulose biosynthesis
VSRTTNCRVLGGYDELHLRDQEWNEILARSSTQSVFQTQHWQRAWWDSFGRGRLLLTAVERDKRPIALAPLFSDGGMVFFVGSGGSDYLDFLGDVSDVQILTQILTVARHEVEDFVGFRFYHVPDGSPTGEQLVEACRRLDLVCFEEESLPAPALDRGSEQSDSLSVAAQKRSLVRHERYFRSHGELVVEHLRTGVEIQPHLDSFFEQHTRRWASTDNPSLFERPEERAFYRRLTESSDVEWLRFTRLTWNSEPIAYHFGFCYRGVYLWYKPTFAVEFARRSPGEVLLRALLLAAREEGARTFDFGLGDEPFKRRFATRVIHVRTWGLYPPEVCRDEKESE